MILASWIISACTRTASVGLHDLVVAVVGIRQHRRPGGEERQALILQPQILGVLERSSCRSRRRRLTSAAAGVSAGMRPSGGSVMIDVRSVLTTLRAELADRTCCRCRCRCSSRRARRRLLVALGELRVPTAAASSGVKNGLSFNSAGRSSGVAVAEFQMPSKFGGAVRDATCPGSTAGIATSNAAMAAHGAGDDARESCAQHRSRSAYFNSRPRMAGERPTHRDASVSDTTPPSCRRSRE